MPHPKRGPFDHEITVRALPAEAWDAPMYRRADGSRGRLYFPKCPRAPGTEAGAFKFQVEEPFVGILGPGTRPLWWVAGWDGDAVFLADHLDAWAVAAEDVGLYEKEG